MIKKILEKIFPFNPTITKVGTSNEDNRITWLEKTLKNIPSGNRILDAGAGEQPFKKYCSHLKYVSQDFAQYNPTELQQGLQMNTWDYGKLDIISDIASVPEPNNSFDAIMCTEVLEHIINPREAINEFSRLLKKNGHLILTAPFCSLTHFAPFHFYTGFSKFFYQNVLKENGFKIIEIQPNGNYFEYVAQELRRINSIGEKYSTNYYITNEEKIQLQKSLKIMERFSKNDKGSSDMLCFGFHTLAQKE